MEDEYGLLPIPHGPDAENYGHQITNLQIYVIQTNNKDWEKSCRIMAAIGRRLTDKSAADATYLEYFRGDTQSVEMLNEYCLKDADLRVTTMSETLRNSVWKDFIDLILTVGPKTACERIDTPMQQALNEFFKQN